MPKMLPLMKAGVLAMKGLNLAAKVAPIACAQKNQPRNRADKVADNLSIRASPGQSPRPDFAPLRAASDPRVLT
eukprot:COSAG04_NODE_18849_length_431_cov_0.759036_1_plen_73_part_10